MVNCSEGAIAAAEDLRLPVARRFFARYGPFDSLFEEWRKEREGEEGGEGDNGNDDAARATLRMRCSLCI